MALCGTSVSHGWQQQIPPLRLCPGHKRVYRQRLTATPETVTAAVFSRKLQRPARLHAQHREGSYLPQRPEDLRHHLRCGRSDPGKSCGQPSDDPSIALLQLPATELNNEYFLVRAGESEAEAENYVLSNPVAKTSMSSGLSRRGKSQVVRQTARDLVNMDACVSGCWLWPSITQRCYQTAEILASLLDISRSRIVPEYSFLDPRGVGSMEGLPLATVENQLDEGDTASAEWRPPHGTDGTPNESVVDLLIRVRQVLSITETQYRGTSVIIISPDSDNLSVIQAALVGADLRNHRRLYSFKPGEVRQLQLAESRPADFFDPRKFSCPNPPLCR
ncbi:hypothetical protein WJX73_003388 [Symbiochloris irregularis]|uniref:Phosphoglycerate mutase n=1 Tax=Symbiochloris irregularis TaxID=706552 RepID=A0AAW1P242_9CHLO